MVEHVNVCGRATIVDWGLLTHMSGLSMIVAGGYSSTTINNSTRPVPLLG